MESQQSIKHNQDTMPIMCRLQLWAPSEEPPRRLRLGSMQTSLRTLRWHEAISNSTMGKHSQTLNINELKTLMDRFKEDGYAVSHWKRNSKFQEAVLELQMETSMYTIGDIPSSKSKAHVRYTRKNFLQVFLSPIISFLNEASEATQGLTPTESFIVQTMCPEINGIVSSPADPITMDELADIIVKAVHHPQGRPFC